MKVFNARHFLRHISMPTLREFTDTHVLWQRLTIDWTQPPESLPAAISDAVDAMTASSRDPALDVTERESLEKDLLHWYDDLRRAHLLGHGQASPESKFALSGSSPLDASPSVF